MASASSGQALANDARKGARSCGSVGQFERLSHPSNDDNSAHNLCGNLVEMFPLGQRFRRSGMDLPKTASAVVAFTIRPICVFIAN